MDEAATIEAAVTAPAVVIAHPKMPPEIAKAIIKVKGQIQRLEKDATNPFGRYKYTSVDQFFEEVGHPMAEAGLFVICHEISTEVRQMSTSSDSGQTKTSNWLICEYDLVIYHESGAEFGPMRRKIQVVASGPQAYGAGASYVEKYFLRSLFKIPTGDTRDDADSQPQERLPKRDERPAPANERNLDDERREVARHTKTARDFVANSIAWFKSVTDDALLASWWEREKEPMAVHFSGREDPLYLDLRSAFVARRRELAPPENEDERRATAADAKPSTANVDVEKLFAQFTADLKMASDEATCNAIYASLIEPHEASLSSDTLGELMSILRDRVERVTTPQ